MATMPDLGDELDDEPDTLADKHDGAEVSREHIQATMQYDVVLDEETVEEIAGPRGDETVAERVAASQMTEELDPTFSVKWTDAMAQEDDSYALDGKRRFTVLVTISQND